MPTLRQYVLLALFWAFVGWATLWGWTAASCGPAQPASWCDVAAIRQEGRWMATLGSYYVGRAPLVGFVLGLIAAPSLTACTPRLPTVRKLLLHALIWSIACGATFWHWNAATQSLQAATAGYLPWAPLVGALAGTIASPILGAPVERRVPGLRGRVLGAFHDALTAVNLLAVGTLVLIALASPKGVATDSYGKFDPARLAKTWTSLLSESSPSVLLGILLFAAIASDRVGHLYGRPLAGLAPPLRRAVAGFVLHLHYAMVAVLVMIAGTVALMRLWPHDNGWDTLQKTVPYALSFWTGSIGPLLAVALVASLVSRWIVVRFAARPADVPTIQDALGDGADDTGAVRAPC